MSLKISDSVWLATALLHTEDPNRKVFSGAEIRARAAKLFSPGSLPAGVNPHIYGHCVANAQPSSGRYRMLFRTGDSTLRLYRTSDPFHPRRAKGRMTPREQDLPEQYRWLLDWYRSDYDVQLSNPQTDDPLMALKGLGKEIWESLGGGDAVIRWLRSDESPPPPWEGLQASSEGRQTSRAGLEQWGEGFEQVWEQIRNQQGDVFQTKTGLPFTYQVAGNSAVWVQREEHGINRQLPRGDFEKAWRRRPLTTTRQIQDLQGPSYLFAILTDPRVAA